MHFLFSSNESANYLPQTKIQKYLLSFVLTGDPNTLWADDKPYWPQYGNASRKLVFNSSFYLAEDDLANAKSLFWNKALWY